MISLGSGRPFEVEAVLSLYTMKRGPEVAALGSMVLILLEVPAGAVEMGTIWKAAHHKRAEREAKNERLNIVNSERVAIKIVVSVKNEMRTLKSEKQEEVKAENK